VLGKLADKIGRKTSMTLTTFGLLIFNTGADIHLIFREILFLSGIFVILGTKFWNQ